MKNIFFLMNYLRIHVIALHGLIMWQLVTVKSGVILSKEQYLVILALTSVLGFVYIHNKYSDQQEDGKASAVVSSSSVLYISFSLLVLSLLLSLSLSASFFFTCLFFALIGYLYNQGFEFKNISIPRFKKVFFIKTLVAALSWYGSIIACLYFTDSYWGALSLSVDYYLYLLFLFAAFEVWWDIRDVDTDKIHGIRTIPVVLGLKWGYGIFLFLSLISMILRLRYGFSVLYVAMYIPLVLGLLITLRYKIGYHLAVYGFIIFILFQSFS